jgi:hypothetical protein
LSDLGEHAVPPSVSRSAMHVTAPARRFFARSCKSIPERRNIGDTLVLHNRCPARYPQARSHLARQRRDLRSLDVAGDIERAFYQWNDDSSRRTLLTGRAE